MTQFRRLKNKMWDNISFGIGIWVGIIITFLVLWLNGRFAKLEEGE